MLNNAKAKGFWFKAFRGKRFIILKKEKKKLENLKVYSGSGSGSCCDKTVT